MANDVSEMWRAHREESQARRAGNRKRGAELLEAEGVRFTSKNGGAHLIVLGRECLIDFWPGTGRWISRDGTRGFGVHNLIKQVKE